MKDVLERKHSDQVLLFQPLSPRSVAGLLDCLDQRSALWVFHARLLVAAVGGTSGWLEGLQPPCNPAAAGAGVALVHGGGDAPEPALLSGQASPTLSTNLPACLMFLPALSRSGCCVSLVTAACCWLSQRLTAAAGAVREPLLQTQGDPASFLSSRWSCDPAGGAVSKAGGVPHPVRGGGKGLPPCPGAAAAPHRLLEFP